MKNIKKSLTNYVQGKGPKVSNTQIYTCASKDANKLADILITIINEEIDKIVDVKSLTKTRELIDYLTVIVTNYESANRDILKRKLHKLNEKIDRIKEEKRDQFVDIKKSYTELETIRTKIETAQENISEKESQAYYFASYLIENIKDTNYLEYAFKKLPSLVNTQDKDKKSLLRIVTEKYAESIKNRQNEEINYYQSVILLMTSEKNLDLKDIERRKILDEIYKVLNQLSTTKKSIKENKATIENIKNIIETIQNCSKKEKNIEEITKKYNIAIQFPTDVLEEIRISTEYVPTTKDRRKLEEYIITIDNETSSEIDDGLSCRKLENGNYLLGVHTVPVLEYYAYDSPIIQEALSRKRTLYLPVKMKTEKNEAIKVIPIFPYEFAVEEASFLPYGNKLARSHLFEIDKNGEVVDEKFIKTIIHSKQKMTFEEVDHILEKGIENKDLQEMVINLEEVTGLLQKRYKNQKQSEDSIAQRIVKEAMILTGNRVAEFFANPKRNYPFIYRVCEEDKSKEQRIQKITNDLKEIYGESAYQKLSQSMVEMYPNSWYSMSGSHERLGLDHYCHCTAQLIRSADIIAAHALEICYDQKPTVQELQELEKEIQRRIEEINQKEDYMNWFMRECKETYQKRKN